MQSGNTIENTINNLGQEIKELPHFFNELLHLPSAFEKRFKIEHWNNPTISLNKINFRLSEDLTQVFKSENEPIKNAAIIEPLEIPTEDFNYYLQQEAAKFITGKDSKEGLTEMRQVFCSKNVFAMSPYAGLGHLKEAYLESRDLADIVGIPVKLIQPEELITGLEADLYGTKAVLHNAMQQNLLSPDFYDDVFNRLTSEHPGLKNNVIVKATQLITELSLAGIGYDKTSQKIHSKLARANIGEIDKHPQLAKTILKLICEADIGLSEKALVEVNNKLFDVFGEPDLVVSSHANVLRSTESILRKKNPQLADKFNDLIPDNGFISIQEEQGVIATNKELEIFAHRPGPHRGVKIVPSERIAKSLKETFGNEGPIVVTGELLDSITIKQLSEKWSSQNRNIALMVNGNSSNIAAIKKSVFDFIEAGCPREFRLALCLFERGQDEQAQLLFGEDWLKIKTAIDTYPNIHLVASSNKIESAAISPYIFKWAHYNIGKPPGENVFMSAANGCVEACGYSVMGNEQNNMFFNLDKALVSAYPDDNFEKWSSLLTTLPEDVQTQVREGLSKRVSSNNFLDYIYKLEENSFAKDFAIQGYLKSGHLNTLHVLLTQLVQLRDGKLTNDNHEEIEKFMLDVQIRFNEKTHKEMQRYFRGEYSLSYDELTELMPQKFFNKDLIYSEPITDIKKEENIKKTRMVLFGLGATALVAILAKAILSNNKKNGKN